MSEMVANKGIIKELYPELEGVRDKILQLSKDINVPLDKLIWQGNLDEFVNDYAEFGQDYWHKYMVINNRLFDTTNTPDIYDYESEHVDTIKKIAPSTYEIDLYYYNGGTNMEEIITENINEADEAYESKKSANLFYAIWVEGGWGWVTGAGNSSLPTPRLYLSEEKARNTIEKHWPGLVKQGYKIVPFMEVVQ